MTNEKIIMELRKRGYDAEPYTTIKNSVELEGIRILTDSDTAPVIYTAEIIRVAELLGKSFDDVVDKVIEIYKNGTKINFNTKNLTDREFMLSHLYIALQRESEEKLIKRGCQFKNIESYLYIKAEDSEGSYSVKMNDYLLEKNGISEEEAWKQAEKNTYADTVIRTMSELMNEILEHEEYEECEKPPVEMYVVSNKKNYKGASAILNKKAISDFAQKIGVEKFVVLPSSIHEVIIIPFDESMKMDEFTSMVCEVNTWEVAPEERLADMAYIITI
ncbi:MAG: hypothetical protein J6J86_05830 [Lachnospiraceae bacterium]|nr:hypothetical protein [Lachnospiraceae bacterium]